MTKLPGLTRQDDRPSVGSANPGRVQVRNPIGDVALQPQARPVDTYSRPQAPASGPNGLQELAGALAQISPSLTNFLEVSSEKAKKDAEDRAMRRIGGMSFDEARSAVDSGKMTELQNPWFKAAFMRQYGERMAYERVNELTKEYETNFDKNSGDVDALIREHTAADLEQYGENAHFTGAYTKVMDGFAARANQTQAQYQTEQVKQDTVSGVYDTFHGEATTMRADGKSPEEIVAALRGKYQGNRELLHVDFKEQDREMVRLAEAFAAKGDTAMVDAILNSERRGADGTVLGTLASNREFQADAVRIQNAADRKREENNEEAAFNARMTFNEQARTGNLDRDALLSHREKNPGAFTDAQVFSLIGQDATVKEQQAELAAKREQQRALADGARTARTNLLAHNMEAMKTGMLPYIEEATVPTETGETKVISVEEQKKEVAGEIARQSKWLVDHGKATPEQAFAREVEALTVGDLTNPQWASVLQAGPGTATQFTLSGGEKPPTLMDGPDLYMRLHSANPKLLDSHIKDAAVRDFYESYRIATQYAKLAPDQALQMAMMQTSDPDKARATAGMSIAGIEERVRGLLSGGYWHDLLFGAAEPKNRGYVANEIGRLGKFYAQNGMDVEAALNEAAGRFMATHTEVAGNFIYTAGKNVPPNFGDMVEHAIEKYVADFGEAEGVDADDLTIRPATNGNGWLIVHQTGQYPVENAARANLSLRSLYQMEQERQEKAKQGVIDGQHRMQKDRGAGIDPLDRVIPPVRGGIFSGDTYDAIKKRDEEDREASGASPQVAEEEGYTSFSESILPPIRLESILPPVRGGLFSGSDYDEMNKPKSEKD